jgi:mRNA deadenylase 3'-5' endonuclease subunit Ccr4
MTNPILQFRRWSPALKSPQINFGPVLKVVCYNVLAESLEENTTSSLDPQISSFQWRKDRLVREMDAWDADIYCLQEVEHYSDFWEPYFNSRSAK